MSDQTEIVLAVEPDADTQTTKWSYPLAFAFGILSTDEHRALVANGHTPYVRRLVTLRPI